MAKKTPYGDFVKQSRFAPKEMPAPSVAKPANAAVDYRKKALANKVKGMR